jgi:hypothetical protein
MKDEGIQYPVLNWHDKPLPEDELPSAYTQFKNAMLVTLREEDERGKIDTAAGSAPADGEGDGIPDEVQSQADEQVRASVNPEGDAPPQNQRKRQCCANQ